MMKAKEIKEVRGLSVEKLQEKLQELKKDLFMLRMQHATNQLDNPMQIGAVRRTSPASRPLFVRKRPTSEEENVND